MRASLAALFLVVIGGSCCALKSDGAAVAVAQETTPEAVAVSRATGDGHGHFGLNGGYAPDPQDRRPDLARDMAELEDLPPMILRQPGLADLTWDFVHPAPDEWTFEMADAFMEYDRYTLIAELYSHMGMPYFFGADFSQEHLESLAAEGGGTRKEIARFYRDNPLDLSIPKHRKDSEEYVTTVVQRYAGQVQYWEMGTEITMEPTLVEMTKHTYGWVKANDPDCQVIMPSIAGTNERMFQRQIGALDRRLAEGMGAYFDIAGYHDYAGLEGLEDRYDLFVETLAKHGVDKPVWVTETGTSSDPDSILSGKSSEPRQAREVVQRLVILSAKGAEVVLWHNYKHCSRKSEFFGANLVDHRLGPKPGYHTFKLVLQQLDDYRSVEKLPIDGLSAYRFTFDGRAPVFVVWAEVEGTADLSFEFPRAKVTHIIEEPGQTEPVMEEVDGAAVPVGPSPVFITTP